MNAVKVSILFQANNENIKLQELINNLHKENATLLDDLENLTKKLNILEKNSASLYVTAKAEVDRKDRLITELRTELEDLKFRRNKRKYQHSLDEDNVRPAKTFKTQDLNKENSNKREYPPEKTNAVNVNRPVNCEVTRKYERYCHIIVEMVEIFNI